jgi:hypothetical protein
LFVGNDEESTVQQIVNYLIIISYSSVFDILNKLSDRVK